MGTPASRAAPMPGRTRLVQVAHVRWRSAGSGWRRPSAMPGKFSMLINVGTSAVPCCDHHVDGVVGQPGAVLDAIDAGRDQPGQRVLAEHVRGDAGAVGVRGVDRRLEDVVGPQRRQITDVAVDPVADQLDPAVAPPRLLGDRVGQLRFVLDVDRQATAGSAWAGRCAARPG